MAVSLLVPFDFNQPIWLIGVGAAGGLLGIVILLLFLTVVHRRTAEEMRSLLRENVVFPILVVAVCAFHALVSFLGLNA